MKILFMGTPEFACAQLRAIFEAAEENDFQIVGVLCQPDKPKGRGYKMIPPPVKEYALSVGLPVYQPTTLRDEAFAALLSELAPFTAEMTPINGKPACYVCADGQCGLPVEL